MLKNSNDYYKYISIQSYKLEYLFQRMLYCKATSRMHSKLNITIEQCYAIIIYWQTFVINY